MTVATSSFNNHSGYVQLILFPDTFIGKYTGNPNILSAIKINVLLFTCVLVSFFELFSRDLNEAKAVCVGCNIVNY